MSLWLLPWVTVTVVTVAAVTDLRNGRIPNVLTLPAILIGLVGQILSSGIAGLAGSALGLVVCVVVPGVVYKASNGKGIGGGDIKLFAALGAMLGPTHGLEAELSSFLLLALFALFRLAFEGKLGRLLCNSGCLIVGVFVPKLRNAMAVDSVVMTEMRMGPAIALGVIVVLATPCLLRWLPWLT